MIRLPHWSAVLIVLFVAGVFCVTNPLAAQEGEADSPWFFGPPCTPTTPVLSLNSGHEVRACYRASTGEVAQAKAGIWASAYGGLLWFFDRDNPEVLVKVLDGCSINGHRWVFVAPVTDLGLELWVTAPDGRRWIYRNPQGHSAPARSDRLPFSCEVRDPDSDGPDPDGPDLVVSDASLEVMVNGVIEFNFLPTVSNSGIRDAPSTTLRYYWSEDSTISESDDVLASDYMAALPASGSRRHEVRLRAPAGSGTFYVGACVESVAGEADTSNNCSAGYLVATSPSSLTGTWTGRAYSKEWWSYGRARLTMRQDGSSVSGTWAIDYPSGSSDVVGNSGTLRGTVSGFEFSARLYSERQGGCDQAVSAVWSAPYLPYLLANWSTIDCPDKQSAQFWLSRTD